MPEPSAPLMQLGEARPLAVPVPAAGPAPAERARLERRTRLLAYAKRRLGNQLHSAATVREAAQTQLCAYLSIALLLGLGANALAGWWWADPLAALAIAAVALKEGRESWRGKGCCDAC